MRICMVAYSFYESDNRVMRYAETLAQRGDVVDVIAIGKPGAQPFEKFAGVNVYRIQNRTHDEKGKFSYLIKLTLFLLKSTVFLSRMQLSEPYDLIHVHSVPDFEVFAATLPRMCRTKIILDIHDLVPEFYASKFDKDRKSLLFRELLLLERLSSHFAHHVIISNHIWRETIVSRSIQPDRCSVILNYPDPSIFYPRAKTRTDDKFIMVYPGTLNWHQGLDIAIRAFSQIKERTPDAELQIYGRGPERAALESLIAQLGLLDRVLLKDGVPLHEIPEIMANADLGIVPKRDDSFGGEAFSTKILEFMSLGIPVIVSATRIDKHYFNENVVKFFKPDNVEDLAEAMLALRRDEQLRKNLAKNAAKFVVDYSWDRNKTKYLDIVDSLVGDNIKR